MLHGLQILLSNPSCFLGRYADLMGQPNLFASGLLSCYNSTKGPHVCLLVQQLFGRLKVDGGFSVNATEPYEEEAWELLEGKEVVASNFFDSKVGGPIDF